MIKKLKMLLTLRSWLKSSTLSVSGVLGAVVAADLSMDNDIVMTVVQLIASAGGVSAGTALAALLAVREVVAVVLRAKTDRALEDK